MTQVGSQWTGGVALWLAIAFIGIAIFLLVMALLQVLSRANDPVRRRLSALTGPDALRDHERGLFASALDDIGQVFTPRNKEVLARTRERLIQAGFRSKYSVLAYYGARGALTLGLPLLILGVTPFMGAGSFRALFVPFVLSLAVGYISPSFYLDRKIKQRQKALRNALPDALDLLVVCTEAGLSLDGGLQRVCREMDISHPEMMDELTIVLAEMRAGVDRMEALRNLAKRTGLDDIQTLVMTLGQSMRFGTSISTSLRIYSEELREKRMQRAREEAAKLTVKIVIPLGVCFLPGFLIVTAGAAIMSLVKAFGGIG